MKLFENSKIKKIKYGIVTSFVVIVSILFDQISKILTDGCSVDLLGKFLYFDSVHNQGAAYGIFSGQTIWLIVVTSIVLVALVIFNWFYRKKSIFYCISMGLILGGAIGNLIDRIFLGYVRDFIRMSIFSFTFNIADACIMVGVIFMGFFDLKK